jgi:D-3-phosphoglycerate dehydrogenase
MHELLSESDIVTLHVDGRPSNRNFFGQNEFGAMRPGSLFLNLSRGFVVDYAALRQNIESGHIAGAGVDVFPDEPKGRGDEFQSELRGLPNVILTPHIGGSTEEAQRDIGNFVSTKLRDFIAEGNTTLSVNVPHIAPAPRVGQLRLIHLHHNVPGVLARINGILAAAQVNVDAQHLGTRGDIGYVVTDSAAGVTQAIVDEIRGLPETIRLRVAF